MGDVPALTGGGGSRLARVRGASSTRSVPSKRALNARRASRISWESDLGGRSWTGPCLSCLAAVGPLPYFIYITIYHNTTVRRYCRELLLCRSACTVTLSGVRADITRVVHVYYPACARTSYTYGTRGHVPYYCRASGSTASNPIWIESQVNPPGGGYSTNCSIDPFCYYFCCDVYGTVVLCNTLCDLYM